MNLKEQWARASLEVQWLRTQLAITGTWFQPVVQEDSTRHEQLSPQATTTEPECCNY